MESAACTCASTVSVSPVPKVSVCPLPSAERGRAQRRAVGAVLEVTVALDAALGLLIERAAVVDDRVVDLHVRGKRVRGLLDRRRVVGAVGSVLGVHQRGHLGLGPVGEHGAEVVGLVVGDRVVLQILVVVREPVVVGVHPHALRPVRVGDQGVTATAAVLRLADQVLAGRLGTAAVGDVVVVGVQRDHVGLVALGRGELATGGDALGLARLEVVHARGVRGGYRRRRRFGLVRVASLANPLAARRSGWVHDWVFLDGPGPAEAAFAVERRALRAPAGPGRVAVAGAPAGWRRPVA